MTPRELRAVQQTAAIVNSARVIVPTAAEILTWGATVDLPTAGTAYGMSRNSSYERARAGDFPVSVLRVGSRFRVRTAAVMADLGITGEPASREVS